MDAEYQGYYDDIYLYKLKTDKHTKKAEKIGPIGKTSLSWKRNV